MNKQEQYEKEHKELYSRLFGARINKIEFTLNSKKALNREELTSWFDSLLYNVMESSAEFVEIPLSNGDDGTQKTFTADGINVYLGVEYADEEVAKEEVIKTIGVEKHE